MARPRTMSDEAVLRATARAVAAHGPARLTLAAVAREAGLSPATLVQRFGSKRGLLLALTEASIRGLADDFAAARTAAGSPIKALHAALERLTRGVRTREELANSLAFLQLDVADPDFRAAAARHHRQLIAEITALLRAANAAGEIDADADRLARSVQVTHNGSLIAWALIGDGELPEFLRAALDDLLRPYRKDET